MSSKTAEEKREGEEEMQRPVCRMFQLRICTRGRDCPNAHPGEVYSDDEEEEDENEEVGSTASNGPKENAAVCHFFRLNTCRRGDRCPFKHTVEEADVETEGEIVKEPTPPFQESEMHPYNINAEPRMERNCSEITVRRDAFYDNARDPYTSQINDQLHGQPYLECDWRRSYEGDLYHGAYSSRYEGMLGFYQNNIDDRRMDPLASSCDPYSVEDRRLRAFDQYAEVERQRLKQYQLYEERWRENYEYRTESQYPENDTRYLMENESPYTEKLRLERDPSHMQIHRSSSPHSEANKNSGRNYEGDEKQVQSPKASETDGKVFCKYYIRGLCKRGDKCVFVHDKCYTEAASAKKEWLVFCKSLPNKCSRSKCRNVHVSKDEEDLYKSGGGIIGEEILGKAIRLALQYNAPIKDNKQVCKDYLVENCDVVNCPFLHLDKENFSLNVAEIVREQFSKIFGKYEGEEECILDRQKRRKLQREAESQKVIVINMLKPAAKPTPSAPKLPVMLFVPPIMPLFSYPPPAPVLAPPFSKENDIDAILKEKFQIANAKFAKENEQYREQIQKLTVQNEMLYRALDPDQPANDLDEIRLRLLKVCEEINWKNISTHLTETAVDYQHKKTIENNPSLLYPELLMNTTLLPNQLSTTVLPTNSLSSTNNTHLSDALPSLSTPAIYENKSLAPGYLAMSGNSHSVKSQKLNKLSAQSPAGNKKQNIPKPIDDVSENYEAEPMEVENDSDGESTSNVSLNDKVKDKEDGKSGNNSEKMEEKEDFCENTQDKKGEVYEKPARYPVLASPKFSLDWAFQRHLNQFQKNNKRQETDNDHCIDNERQSDAEENLQKSADDEYRSKVEDFFSKAEESFQNEEGSFPEIEDIYTEVEEEDHDLLIAKDIGIADDF